MRSEPIQNKMLAPAPELKVLRRMDYISDQKGIYRRYLRELKGWDQHLEQTGNFITRILLENEFRHIVVLGSGWLLDFPIERILSLVKKITLVDVHFPEQVLKRVNELDNVDCIRADVTGGYIHAVYEQLRHNRTRFFIPGDIKNPGIKAERGKLVLSLNILNQLDILLVDYIQKKAVCNADQILEFRKMLQELHIRMLREHPFILVTDFREILINNLGKILEEKELLFTGWPSGDLECEWDWTFDYHQLYNAHGDTQMKVRAVFSKGPQKL